MMERDITSGITLGVIGAYLIAANLFGEYYTKQAENYVAEVRIERDSANAQIGRIEKEISRLEAPGKERIKNQWSAILSGQKAEKNKKVEACDSKLMLAGREIEKGKIFAKATTFGLAGFFID